MAHPAPLLQALQLGPITLRSRVVMSALTRSRAVPGNIPTDLMVEYYVQRAKGGAGLIVTEGALVTQQGTEWQNAPGVWNDEHVVAWKKVTDAVHAAGGHIFCQLWHVGRLSHPDAPEQKASGSPVYGPSAIAAEGYPHKFRFLAENPGYVTPTEIDDPSKLVELFRKGAIKAKEAGFDGVEIHGANGYLIQQFLDSTTNKRTDKYGGSVANRARFALEVVQACVEVWGPSRVAVKLSPAGGSNDVGMPLDDSVETFTHFIKEAEKHELAYFCFVRYVPALDPVINGKSRGTAHDVLTTFGPSMTRTPIFPNCGLTPEEASTLISSGKISAGVFGRFWIGHPDLAQRIENGKPLDAVLDFKTLYGGGPTLTEEQLRKGYTDYPVAA